MAGSQGFNSLDLKDSPFGDEQVEKVSLLEIRMDDVDGNLDAPAAPVGDLTLIDSLVEASPQVSVHRENVPHHVIRNAAKFLLRQPPRLSMNRNWHWIPGGTRSIWQKHYGEKIATKARLFQLAIFYPSFFCH